MHLTNSGSASHSDLYDHPFRSELNHAQSPARHASRSDHSRHDPLHEPVSPNFWQSDLSRSEGNLGLNRHISRFESAGRGCDGHNGPLAAWMRSRLVEA